MKILIINGPNLNMLGKRDSKIYGDKSLEQITSLLGKKAQKLGLEIASFQNNSEGKLIDFIQEQSRSSDGIIINPGALTHYGLSLRDALIDSQLPIIEVHLSNIYCREEWRAKSVIAPIAQGQISGLGWKGYIVALEMLASELKEET
ncbi:MAG: type II 3-dehydroquinate dehydratase [Dehalococcoidia bacterium]|nr:type II 3-dehydroquinate dehydratase [Dehalococcoidia bacterium]